MTVLDWIVIGIDIIVIAVVGFGIWQGCYVRRLDKSIKALEKTLEKFEEIKELIGL